MPQIMHLMMGMEQGATTTHRICVAIWMHSSTLHCLQKLQCFSVSPAPFAGNDRAGIRDCIGLNCRIVPHPLQCTQRLHVLLLVMWPSLGTIELHS